MEINKIEEIDHRALMTSAREALTGNWGLAVGTTLLYMVILSIGNIIPEVDNEVLIEAKDNYLRQGDFVTVTIVDAEDYDLYGALV